MKNLKREILAVLFFMAGVYLSFTWYDWKLLIIIAIFATSNNLDRTASRLKREKRKET